MANITGESTVSVVLTGTTSGKVTSEELREFLDYLVTTLGQTEPVDCKFSVANGNLLKLTAEVPATSYQPYVAPTT